MYNGRSHLLDVSYCTRLITLIFALIVISTDLNQSVDLKVINLREFGPLYKVLLQFFVIQRSFWLMYSIGNEKKKFIMLGMDVVMSLFVCLFVCLFKGYLIC